MNQPIAYLALRWWWLCFRARCWRRKLHRRIERALLGRGFGRAFEEHRKEIQRQRHAQLRSLVFEDGMPIASAARRIGITRGHASRVVNQMRRGEWA